VTTTDIKTLYAYNRWANRRMLAAARAVAAADRRRSVGASHVTLEGILAHILWAEWLWLQRWQGDSPMHPFRGQEYGDLDGIAAQWAEVERGQDAWLDALTDAKLRERVSYENFAGERWTYSLEEMMLHLANHSTYHRGQVVTALRHLGQQPPATDFLVFLDERGPGSGEGV
jgi:uncharacterized damage-inducible protein DinB